MTTVIAWFPSIFNNAKLYYRTHLSDLWNRKEKSSRLTALCQYTSNKETLSRGEQLSL